MSPSAQIHGQDFLLHRLPHSGFGSIGKGTLPLIERHLDYDKSRITVIDPPNTAGPQAHFASRNVPCGPCPWDHHVKRDLS